MGIQNGRRNRWWNPDDRLGSALHWKPQPDVLWPGCQNRRDAVADLSGRKYPFRSGELSGERQAAYRGRRGGEPVCVHGEVTQPTEHPQYNIAMFRSFLPAVCAVLLIFEANAQTPPGKTAFLARCAGCHGEDGS